jgi:hypothetical protein
MPDTLKPIKRVWKPKAPVAHPTQAKFDIYGNNMPEQEVQEKNSDSAWDTFEALQAAEAARVAKLKQEKG